MRLHGAFYALKPAAQHLENWLNGEQVFDGAYSRVVPLAPHSVLKATLCEPTNLLLKTLAKKRPTVRGSGSLALPVVLESHGLAVRDDDGLDYTCWTLERLFSPDDYDGMRHARVYGRESLARFKPSYRGRYCHLHTDEVNKVQEQLTKQQARWGHENGWEACAHIALAMSLQSTGELKETFLFLQKFVTTHKVALDLLTRGNLLVNLFGEVTLSDPVCESDESLQPREICRANQICLSAWVPAAMDGLNLSVMPMSTGPLSADMAAAKAAQMQHLGITPMTMSWGSPEHVAFLGEPPKTAKAWSYDNAVRRLRDQLYQKLFEE